MQSSGGVSAKAGGVHIVVTLLYGLNCRPNLELQNGAKIIKFGSLLPDKLNILYSSFFGRGTSGRYTALL